ACRREDDRRIELLTLTRPARPRRPHLSRESLRSSVAVAGECEHLASVRPRDLYENLRRRPEAVEADAFRLSSEPVCAKADQAGTQQRRRFFGAVRRRDIE